MKPTTIIMLTAFAQMTAGCTDQATVATHTLPAPGGSVIAYIRTVQYGGPGTAALITTVSLAAGRRGRVTDILTVEVPDQQGGHVLARWLDPTHLALNVRNATIDFQAVRCAGVTINTYVSA